jgi:hypothetical protein
VRKKIKEGELANLMKRSPDVVASFLISAF